MRIMGAVSFFTFTGKDAFIDRRNHLLEGLGYDEGSEPARGAEFMILRQPRKNRRAPQLFRAITITRGSEGG
jgi:hypothetical protein